jgi:hypothetical protein
MNREQVAAILARAWIDEAHGADFYGMNHNDHICARARDTAWEALMTLESLGFVIAPIAPTQDMVAAVKNSPLLNGYESLGVMAIAWPLMLANSPTRK